MMFEILKMQASSFFRKVIFNFIENLTLFLSGLVLAALFLYVFGDFVRGSLTDLSERGRVLLGSSYALIIGYGLAVLVSGWLKQVVYQDESFLPVMNHLGYTQGEMDQYRRKLVAIYALLLSGLVILATWNMSMWILLLSLLIAVTRFFSMTGHSDNEDVIDESVSPEVILDWRRHQFLHRKMPGKKTIFAGLVLAVAIPLSCLTRIDFVVIELLSLALGIVCAFGVSHGMVEDLRGTWFEKQAGLSHDEWIKSWQHIAQFVALLLFLAGAGGLLVRHSVHDVDWTLAEWSLPFIAFFCPYLVPCLALQVDGRSRNLNGLIILFVGVFVGTAMMATPWAAALVPIIKTQAGAYQKGRFNRA